MEYFWGCEKQSTEVIAYASLRQRSPDHNGRGDLNATLINRTDKFFNHACCWPWSVRRYACWKRSSHTCTHTRREIANNQKKKEKNSPPAEVGSSPSAAAKETKKREKIGLKRGFVSRTKSRWFDRSVNCAVLLQCAWKHFLRHPPRKPTEHSAGEARRTRWYSQHPAGRKTTGCCGNGEPGPVSHPPLRPFLPAGFWSTALDYYAQRVRD